MNPNLRWVLARAVPSLQMPTAWWPPDTRQGEEGCLPADAAGRRG